MKPVGGTPGLGMGGRPPGVDDEGGSWGPDKLAAGIEGPGGGNTGGPAVDGGCGWNGWWGRKPGGKVTNNYHYSKHGKTLQTKLHQIKLETNSNIVQNGQTWSHSRMLGVGGSQGRAGCTRRQYMRRRWQSRPRVGWSSLRCKNWWDRRLLLLLLCSHLRRLVLTLRLRTEITSSL